MDRFLNSEIKWSSNKDLALHKLNWWEAVFTPESSQKFGQMSAAKFLAKPNCRSVLNLKIVQVCQTLNRSWDAEMFSHTQKLDDCASTQITLTNACNTNDENSNCKVETELCYS